jgi:cytochrome c oxidase cbb3-type subunit I/II
MAEHHDSKWNWHRPLERNLPLLAVLSTIAILIGGLVEIVPMFSASFGPEAVQGVTPYTPLEVAGRDIYIREGCYTCHSQMVRPTRSELLRYGEWSRAGEYAYDHPFQLGSRRMGPDLHRVGGKYPDVWHYEHMLEPLSTSPGSLMPTYPWLFDRHLDTADVRKSVTALRRVGVPYTDDQVAGVAGQMREQGTAITGRLQAGGITADPGLEIVALIAYLQRLGVDGRAAIKAREQASAGATP